MTAGIFLIATNKYIKFVEPLITSIKTNFLPKTNLQVFLFSNIDEQKETLEALGNQRIKLKYISIEHQPWPMMTLLRYEIFLKAQEFITEDIDHLFYLDVDMLVCSEVKEKEILLQNKGLIATAHPGFFDKPKEMWTFENSPKSLACITKQNEIDWCVNYYFAGGFQGGTTEEYLEAVKTMSTNIQTDLKNNIVAMWHDESHWNRYCATNKLRKILHPGFCYPESQQLPFQKKIVALDKNHTEMRKEEQQ
jgi:histo-blood group ABO system transferase